MATEPPPCFGLTREALRDAPVDRSQFPAGRFVSCGGLRVPRCSVVLPPAAIPPSGAHGRQHRCVSVGPARPLTKRRGTLGGGELTYCSGVIPRCWQLSRLKSEAVIGHVGKCLLNVGCVLPHAVLAALSDWGQAAVGAGEGGCCSLQWARGSSSLSSFLLLPRRMP